MEFDISDPVKNELNLKNHKISLVQAQALWNGKVIEIPSKKPGEPRKLVIGKIDGKFWTAITTMRGEYGEKTRIISCRRSRENEEKIYNQRIHNG